MVANTLSQHAPLRGTQGDQKLTAILSELRSLRVGYIKTCLKEKGGACSNHDKSVTHTPSRCFQVLGLLVKETKIRALPDIRKK